MPGPFPELDVAVRQLYETFAIRHGRPDLRDDFCAHCVAPGEAHALVSTPVSDLAPGLLRVFVANAISWTWGTPNDLWRYLPRILELVASGEFGRYDIGGLFTAMSADWPNWPKDQRDAVTAYLTALWRATIGGYWLPAKLDVLDLLEAAGELEVPVDPFLRAWEIAGSEAAALHLAWLIRRGLSRWDTATAEWSQVVAQWIRGAAARRVLILASAAASTPEISASLSSAIGELDAGNPPGDPHASSVAT